ncbi:MAG: glycosyltransferase [Candidatus Roizmanbacteria bacterium]|nr:MAG: glycosyltransferase [Candidatus Roizmanbacteria bacterium]
MKPFFSIIIPTLNEERYLPKILRSLSNQTDKSFEVIIVDAHSEDKTKEVALQFSNKFIFNFFEVDKRNVSFQRNFGVSKSEGDYLIFLDADAGISLSFIKGIKKIITHKKGLVFIPHIIPDEKNQFDIKLVFNVVNFLIDASQYVGKPLSSGGSMIFEKNFFLRIGGFDESLPYAEDHNLVQKAYKWGVRANFLPQIKVKFSLRRLKREGRLKLLYKYLLSTAYVLVKGDIKKKIYNYEMGGQFYANKNKEALFKDYITQVNNYFKGIFKED